MTTIIMISKNNSVIINNGDDHDMESSVDPSTEELMSGYSTGYSPDHGQISPGKSSVSSQNSENLESPTPDSSFLTPKPLARRRRLPRKSSISTLESDSEELNNSSSSAASTLSSRTSGVSSGLSSSSRPGSLLVSGIWYNSILENAEDTRNYATLGHRRNRPGKRISRAQSFTCVNQANYPCVPIGVFEPSSNSAFKPMTQSTARQFVTSTPQRPSRTTNHANTFFLKTDRPTQEEKPQKRQTVRKLSPIFSTLLKYGVSSGPTSPVNGPHGNKFFVTNSGHVDIKPPKCSNNSVGNSNSACYDTRSLGRNLSVHSAGEQDTPASAINTNGLPNYCTLGRRVARSRQSNISSASSASIRASLSHVNGNSNYAKIYADSSYSVYDHIENYSGYGYSEYAHGDSGVRSLAETADDGTDQENNDWNGLQDADQKNKPKISVSCSTSPGSGSLDLNKLKPIGSVLPSGCHRHPGHGQDSSDSSVGSTDLEHMRHSEGPGSWDPGTRQLTPGVPGVPGLHTQKEESGVNGDNGLKTQDVTTFGTMTAPVTSCSCRCSSTTTSQGTQCSLGDRILGMESLTDEKTNACNQSGAGDCCKANTGCGEFNAGSLGSSLSVGAQVITAVAGTNHESGRKSQPGEAVDRNPPQLPPDRKQNKPTCPSSHNLKQNSVLKAKSFDGLSGLFSKHPAMDDNPGESTSCAQTSLTPCTKSKFSPLSGLSGLGASKLLRRHTVYVKGSMNQAAQTSTGHVHSWHKQSDDSQRGSRSSSLKKQLMGRSSSSSRNPPKSDAGEVTIMDERETSIDRVSIHSADQPLLDEDEAKDEVDSLSQPDLTRDRSPDRATTTSLGIGRVGSWAADFDKLLSDPSGLQTFAEFLKKEISHENIYFWCGCEKYSSTQDGNERMKIAEAIMERHLDIGAIEPVNIDGMARGITRDSLANATEEHPPDRALFQPAQKQIYNLMKFDSFPRFLKSQVYKECLLAEMAGKPLPYNRMEGIDNELLTNKIVDNETKDKTLNNRRKSLLVWPNLVTRNRSKSKERTDTSTSDSKSGSKFRSKKSPLVKRKNSSSSDRTRTSITSDGRGQEMKKNTLTEDTDNLNEKGDSCDSAVCVLTRVILPDKATTVVNTSTGETIRSLVVRLLEKRGLKFTSFDVFITGSEKPLDLSLDCCVLACAEVRVEPRVLFRLELPSRKSIGVKAKQTKMVEDVLRPILEQYGWNLDILSVKNDGDNKSKKEIDLFASVISIDNSRLVVSIKSPEELNWRGLGSYSHHSGPGPGPAQQNKKNFDGEMILMPPPSRIPPSRKKSSVPSAVQSFGGSDQTVSLYEGLQRMTKGRLEDQRGTEINGELPEFLRKEIQQAPTAHLQSPSLPDRHNESDLSSPCVGSDELRDDWDCEFNSRYLDYVDSTFTGDGLIPTLAQAEDLFMDRQDPASRARVSLGMACQSPDKTQKRMDGLKLVAQPSIGNLPQEKPHRTLPKINLQATQNAFKFRPGMGEEEGGEVVSRKLGPPLLPKPARSSANKTLPHLHQEQFPGLRSKVAGLMVLPKENACNMTFV